MDNTEVIQRQQKHIQKMLSGELFVTDIDRDKLWELYLDSFPEGTNEIFRERREFDCSTCRHFIKHFGHVVALKDNKIVTIWDFDVDGDAKWQPVIKAMGRAIKSSNIETIFVTKEKKFGAEKNFEDGGEHVITWHHFNVSLPKAHIHSGSKSVDSVIGTNNSDFGVFKRGMSELSIDSLATVLEIINDSDVGLHRGKEWKSQLESYFRMMREYETIPTELKNNYLWSQFVKHPRSLTTLRNSSIGTLLVNLSEGMDVNTAVAKYEDIVSNGNYKRSTPVVTKGIAKAAKAKFEEMGLLGSLNRRFATLDDISIADTLFVDRKTRSLIEKSDPFEALTKKQPVDPKSLKRIVDITIDKFIQDVLPNAEKLELLLENRLTPNLVSLIAPVDGDAPSMFKWDNAFSWAYNGNATGKLKENVKLAGGNIEGVLRFSIQWNDIEDDQNDLDAHASLPNGNHISFMERTNRTTGGKLDIDIIHPRKKVAVENITFPSIERMPDGKYLFYVKNYNNRGGRSGFRAEIEFDGQIFEYNYDKPIRENDDIDVATVTLKKGQFSIRHHIDSATSTKEVWNVNTQQFIPVKIVSYSPNYWGDKHVGNKHYFFMLDGVINETCPNGFFNEFLNEEMKPYRKFIEALAYELAVAPDTEQLSGVGFSSTQRDDFLVRVTSEATTRIMKVRVE